MPKKWCTSAGPQTSILIAAARDGFVLVEETAKDAFNRLARRLEVLVQNRPWKIYWRLYHLGSHSTQQRPHLFVPQRWATGTLCIKVRRVKIHGEIQTLSSIWLTAIGSWLREHLVSGAILNIRLTTGISFGVAVLKIYTCVALLAYWVQVKSEVRILRGIPKK
jgi:hypothetical protein